MTGIVSAVYFDVVDTVITAELSRKRSANTQCSKERRAAFPGALISASATGIGLS